MKPASTGRAPARALGAIVAGVVASGAAAHVSLDAPDGGESLVVGSTFTITWHVIIGHSTIDWDLWYSVTGPDGPWIELATDLPPGDILSGAVHNYEWTVPDDASDQVRVRVRQDNDGTDYLDVSVSDLSIVAPSLNGDATGDGVVNVSDIIQVITDWGPCPDPPAACASDLDQNGAVNVTDLNEVIVNWSV